MTNITQSKTSIVTDSVKLNAINSSKLANFYQEAIGLTLLEEKADLYYWLGTEDGKVLLEIEQTDKARNNEATGLYHHALLLPTYEDFGSLLHHLIISNVQLIGASDHGYSNAFYLDDPEGNGIEIYWDKDESEWDILEDGSIAGITEPMDAEAALAAAKPSFDKLPNGTTMGHVHLHVDNLEASIDFYTEVLGLGLKYKYGPAAVFLASGNYHHHLGANIWKRGELSHPKEGEAGLGHTRWAGSTQDLEYIEQELTKRKMDFLKSDGTITVTDPSGLSHIITTTK